MSEFPISPEDLRRLAKLVERHELTELRFEDEALRITLRTTAPVAPATGAEPVLESLAALSHGPDLHPIVETSAETGGIKIEAPIMGTFYRSPAPGAPPFVEVGDRIEAGDPIGVIEAMKVFSEVLSEHSGVVQAIPMENGKLVQPGDVLVVLEAS